MFRSYSITCHCHFDHEDENGNCIARLIHQDRHMLIIEFCTDLNGLKSVPVKYALCEYGSKMWITNLEDNTTVFISHLMNTESTADELLDLDIDDNEAEELTEVLNLFYIMTIPKDPADAERTDYPYIEDYDLPF